jgi:two-component system NarL family response regulator
MKIQTVIAIEDDLDLAENLQQILTQQQEFEYLAGFNCAEQALKSLEVQVADLYLVDLGLPGIGGLEFIKRARQRCPQSDFIIYTISESGRDLLEALSVGAAGYLVKGCTEDEMISGLRTVADGGGLITPRMARKLSQHFSAIGSQSEPLTKMQKQVLGQLKTGKTYSRIADANHVSISTVQTHVKNIYRKLNVNNRDDAVRTGELFGLVK